MVAMFLMLLIPAFRGHRPVDLCELEARLVYIGITGFHRELFLVLEAMWGSTL